MKRTLFFWIPAAILLAGCAAAPTVVEQKDMGVAVIQRAEEPPATAPRQFEDRDLLLEGVALLNPQDRSDPAKARELFGSLIQRYPQSRWRPAAETFIRLMDEREAYQVASGQARLLMDKNQEEKLKALQENDRLKKTVRELTEKLQSENGALALENEQLKKEMQQLKDLEIELEKRERTLR
jgi:hypothetical protein